MSTHLSSSLFTTIIWSLTLTFFFSLNGLVDVYLHGFYLLNFVEGITRLLKMGVDLVFVIGHPEYYPRFGFASASKLGFQPAYPLPAEVAAAWMVLVLRPNIIGATSGKVICCDVMNKPEVLHQ